MPNTARSVSSSQPPPTRHANDVSSPRQTRSSPRHVVADRLVLSPGLPCSSKSTQPAFGVISTSRGQEAGAADVDVALGDLAGDERQPVLVLLTADELPGREEHHAGSSGQEDAHRWVIGVRPPSAVACVRCAGRRYPATVTRCGEPRLRRLTELVALPRRSPLYPELARALAAADALHLLHSDLEPVPVRPTSTTSQSGCYRLRKEDPVDLRVSRRHGRISLSFLHELGHLRRSPARRVGSATRGRPAATRRSATGARQRRSCPRAHLPARAAARRRYFDSAKEVWARGYAQSDADALGRPRARAAT